MRDIIGTNQERIESIGAEGTVVDSDGEYREFVEEHPLPAGYVWGRSPFGAPPGSWKTHIKEKPEIRGTNTDLEQRLAEYLERWGYRGHFEHDYRHLGYQLDFADPDENIALEPGAAYWHTPESYSGETRDGFGEKPDEVYWPPAEKDVKKHQSLEDNGWRILWINEDGLDGEWDAIREWLAGIYE